MIACDHVLLLFIHQFKIPFCNSEVNIGGCTLLSKLRIEFCTNLTNWTIVIKFFVSLFRLDIFMRELLFCSFSYYTKQNGIKSKNWSFCRGISKVISIVLHENCSPGPIYLCLSLVDAETVKKYVSVVKDNDTPGRYFKQLVEVSVSSSTNWFHVMHKLGKYQMCNVIYLL